MARPVLIVAAVTPLTDGGVAVDEAAIGPYVEFLEARGADGVFACGTTGEGVLLAPDERRAVAVAFRQALRGTLIVHAGAQTTADTVALAAHAAEGGADAVAVIAPPYFPLDAAALTTHFVAAARACAPLPFYCYAFAARSGYPLPVEVIQRIRDQVDNLAGLKVSESPWAAVAPYMDLGLPVLIGSEPLIPAGLRAGAIGAVSALSAAFPEVVREALDDPSAAMRLADLRAAMEAGGHLIAAAKHVLGLRGSTVGRDVRPPLRSLTPAEASVLETALEPILALPA
ncbi:MAG: dihydrodipicolinate synthase family protein [Candidatus Limnocylindria bacterium]